jgi:predicted RNA-binding Zn ribbon-like protein
MPQAQTLDSFGWPGRDWRLALADTIAVVRDEEVDLLPAEPDLARWLEAEQGWLGPVPPGDAPALAAVRELRGAIRSLLTATVAGTDLPEDEAAVVNRFSAGGAWYRRLDLSQPGGPRAVYEGVGGDRARQVLATIAGAAIDLLTGPDRQRIKLCRAPSCGMFFLAGKRGQQWCSVPCGNRARVARHYERSRLAER